MSCKLGLFAVVMQDKPRLSLEFRAADIWSRKLFCVSVPRKGLSSPYMEELTDQPLFFRLSFWMTCNGYGSECHTQEPTILAWIDIGDCHTDCVTRLSFLARKSEWRATVRCQECNPCSWNVPILKKYSRAYIPTTELSHFELDLDPCIARCFFWVLSNLLMLFLQSMPQPWILFLWICPACGYVLPGLRGALAVEGPSHGQLGAKDLVRMLQEAAAAKGIPENWPDSQLDIASAKLVIELEHVRILAWKEWAMQEAAYCKDHPKQRRSRLRGGRPQWTGAARFWPKALASLLLVILCVVVGIRSVMRWIQESRHNVQALTLELQGCRDRSATRARQDTAQQTELPAAQSESEPQEHGDASPPGVSRKELCLKPPAWLRDDQPPPWSAARHCSRFMVQPCEWSEEFDGAYIGLVEEFGDEIASGFGGAVKQARWADFVVASKRFHRGDAELFAELYFGLLIGASPVIGFGVTAEGHPRLVSAWLQETSLQRVRRMASTEAGCLEASKRFMCDLLLAVMSVHSIGLVHGDIKTWQHHAGGGWDIVFDRLRLRFKAWRSLPHVLCAFQPAGQHHDILVGCLCHWPGAARIGTRRIESVRLWQTPMHWHVHGLGQRASVLAAMFVKVAGLQMRLVMLGRTKKKRLT